MVGKRKPPEHHDHAASRRSVRTKFTLYVDCPAGERPAECDEDFRAAVQCLKLLLPDTRNKP